MKLWCCAALLLAGYASAGELLPLAGQQSTHVQQALDRHLLPVVIEIPGITVEPVLESLDISGRAKRLAFWPLAGRSHIVLRIRIVDGEIVTEETFSIRGGAWKGTFRPGGDYALLDQIAKQAAEFVAAYP